MTTARLQQLRANARLERDVLLEHRMRDGQDPAIAISEVPDVDELVVLSLRDEMLEDRGQLAEFSLARLAARSAGPDADEHRRNADRAEFELLREIAAQVPELTRGVWAAAARLEV
ncbi:hypothetical protein [Leucobacter ruminantium]|uniref:Uncharacterized protein n=1 Tax=Leucobacter ruminantium TaxID=1289170 RepID=A0A939LZL5_9MICO|nr:hypothetical protein [Leucobacter ruminantium]MBO1805352.1 hypothetical protein [Leucobacter ruminantium]